MVLSGWDWLWLDWEAISCVLWVGTYRIMFLKGWSSDHLCQNNPGAFINMQISRQHLWLVEPQSLGWGSQCDTKFLKQLQCRCCKNHTFSKLNRGFLFFVFFFRKEKGNITELFAKLVTNLKVFKPYPVWNNFINTRTIFSFCIFTNWVLFQNIIGKKTRNVSSEYYRHYIIKNVFKMAAFW